MSITSFTFIGFVFATLIVYYLVPKKLQWVVLLAASMAFYLICGRKSILYVLITATTIYFAAVRMQALTKIRKAYLKEHKAELSREEKKQYKKQIEARRKRILVYFRTFSNPT